jgi:hypothetical protein
MEQLKKYGFVIGVAVMALVLLVFAYFYVYGASSEYEAKASGLQSAEKTLNRFASMKPDQLPTKLLVEKRSGEQEKLAAALTEAERFYEDSVKKLEELRFQPDGAVIPASAAAQISSAFETVLRKFNEDYLKVKKAYIKKVFPAPVAQGAPEPQPIAIDAPEEIKDAGERCRIARAIFTAAMDSAWGGMTVMAFEKKKARALPSKSEEAAKKKAEESEAKAKAKAKAKGKTTKTKAGKQGAKAEEPEAVAEAKPIDSRLLYDKVKVTIAGEIRFQDLGPFLYQVYRRAQDDKDPVLFILEDMVLTKQPDRLPKSLYPSNWPNEQGARSAPPDSEQKVPTATLRLTLSAVRWKVPEGGI